MSDVVDFDPFAEPAILLTTSTTEGQRELFTASMLGDDASRAFNEALKVRFEGPLEVEALREAVRALGRSHEALHASLSGDGRSWLVEPPTLDLTIVDATNRPELLDQLEREQVEKPFALHHAPLARATLVVRSSSEHFLLFSAHHVVCDGWSMGVILRDLAELYRRAVSGEREVRLERTPFSKYADLEASEEHQKALTKALECHLPKLSGSLPLFDLPTLVQRPALKTFTSERLDHRLDADLVEALKGWGRSRKASFFATLLTTFQAFLSRVSGATDLIVGIPVAGQSATGMSDLVGHAVRTIPVRVALDASTKLEDLAAATRHEVFDALEHGSVTFGEFVRKLALPRDPSRLPLLNVCFNLDTAIEELSFGAGLSADFETIPRAFENFDLFVNAVEKNGSVVLEIQFNSDLYPRESIRNYFESYEAILRSFVAGRARKIADLGLMTPRAEAIYDAMNRTAIRERGAADTLSAILFAERDGGASPRDGNKEAVIAEDGTLSYAELARKSENLAQILLEEGVRPGEKIGVCLKRGRDLLVTLLGILRAGAAYVPLEPTFPAERLAFMAEDAGVRLLLTEEDLVGVVPEGNSRKVFARELIERVPGKTYAIPPESPEAPAYMIYTSGSTGKPKGVVVPRRAMANFIRAMQAFPGVRTGERLLAVTTISFDISVFELFATFATGATIVLATSAMSGDGTILANVIREAEITMLQATPVTFRLLQAASAKYPPGFVAIMGGEPLPKDLAQDLHAQSVRVVNGYGPTETTVYSTTKELRPGFSRVTIGAPVENTVVFIVDENMNALPPMVAGELCIGGLGVTLGYHGREELTAEKFVRNPFGPGLLYRTGDLARLLPEGEIDCLGRLDGQVKLRGYRIELGEIEAVIGESEEIENVAVMLREDRPGDQRLVAYVVSRPPGIAKDVLKERLGRRLPSYMVPSVFVDMSSLPLTGSGKVDRKKLPAPQGAVAATKSERTPPSTPNEKLVAATWEKILHTRQLAVEDDFFELGGHSLLVAQVVAELRKHVGSGLSMRKLFETRTIRALAASLDELAARDTPEVARQAQRPTGPILASTMQERLWFVEETQPGTLLYNVPASFRLRGTIAPTMLEEAMNRVLERHETLRTRFFFADGRLFQEALPFEPRSLPIVDLSDRGSEDREKLLLEGLQDEARIPFDLRSGAPFRAKVFRLADDDHVLFILAHHAVWDGWSFDVFLAEFGEFFGALREGRAHRLAPLPMTYAEFSTREREQLVSPAMKKQTEEWLEVLRGELPVLDLPTDRARPSEMSYRGATVEFTIPKELVDRLGAVAAKSGATIYMLSLAAYEILLHRYSGQKDFIIGTPVRGRLESDIESLLGYFVNTLPLRLGIDENASFSDQLANVRDAVIAALGRQDTPVDELVRKLDLPRDPSRNPLYSAYFSFQDVRNRLASIGGVPYEQIHVLPDVCPADVLLWMKQTDRDLLAGLDYATDLFDRETAERMARHLVRLLEEVARDPALPVSRLELVSEEERLELARLGAKSEPALGYSAEQRVLELASQSPSLVAGHGVSFAELVGRGRSLAAKLSDAGVVRGSAVGIFVEPSIDGAVAALGTLLAGGVVLPLEPAAPFEDLKAFVNEAAVGAIVVHAKTKGRAAVFERKLVTLEEVSLASADSFEVPAGALEEAAYLLYSKRNDEITATKISRKALGSLATRAAELSRMNPGEKALLASSGAAGVLALWSCLVSGTTVVALDRETSGDADLLEEALEDHAPNHLWASTQKVDLLGSRGGLEGLSVVVVGELISPSRGKSLEGRVGRLTALYGPEGALGGIGRLDFSGTGENACIVDLAAGAVPLVLDEHGRTAVRGARGRFHIGGDFSLATGENVRWDREGRIELSPGNGARGSAATQPDPIRERLAVSPEQLPQTSTERWLAEAWRELLILPNVGRSDNFFDLGGHSLLALQLQERVRKALGKELNPRVIVRNNLTQTAHYLDSEAPSVGIESKEKAPEKKGSLLSRIFAPLRND